MKDYVNYGDGVERVLGEYTSVNDLPEYADYIKEAGPFDSERKFTLIRNDSYQFTPGAADAIEHMENPADNMAKFYVDYDAFDSFAPFNGVQIIDKRGNQIRVGFGGQMYNFHMGNYNNRLIVYAIAMDSLIYGQEVLSRLSIPWDHPVIQMFRTDGFPVPEPDPIGT